MSPALITGGSGFIGVNLAHRLLSSGETVYIFDNLSRSNVTRNLQWLVGCHGSKAIVHIEDTRDSEALRRVVRRVDQVFHFAAQVAVTSSVENPRNDFETNVLGTFNLLEEIRSAKRPPGIIFTSTNKVYGALNHLPLKVEGKRYLRADGHDGGIDETDRLDFHSPYGCSKGAAEQYVLDYSRTYGIASVVFRMSCIYGPHQFGSEDQGWVAHIIGQVLQNKPVTIFGNGYQVRDLLFVDDLVNAFLLARKNIEELSGQAFNIGGGSANTISLLELMDILQDLGETPRYAFSDGRIGDQKYYVSDYSRFKSRTGWIPRVGLHSGIGALTSWLRQALREQQNPNNPMLSHAS